MRIIGLPNLIGNRYPTHAHNLDNDQLISNRRHPREDLIKSHIKMELCSTAKKIPPSPNTLLSSMSDSIHEIGGILMRVGLVDVRTTAYGPGHRVTSTNTFLSLSTRVNNWRKHGPGGGVHFVSYDRTGRYDGRSSTVGKSYCFPGHWIPERRPRIHASIVSENSNIIFCNLFNHFKAWKIKGDSICEVEVERDDAYQWTCLLKIEQQWYPTR